MIGFSKYYDLSVPLEDKMPLYPGNVELNISPIATPDKDGFGMESYSSSTHCGTHIDAPFHFHQDGATIDKAPLSAIMGSGYVIRPSHHDDEIFMEDLEGAWKPEYDGRIILINTGWDRKRDFSDEFQKHFPGLAMDTVPFLNEHRIDVIGIDTLGIEPFKNSDFKVHRALLARQRFLIEDLANLDKLETGKEYFIAALPLKVRSGSGAMARVVAAEP
ncbi:MAG TPA: cyclase family protein [Thermoplasmataceae archaeon]|nr:cyclase family protein [Thermoplasmataceae archaeon]